MMRTCLFAVGLCLCAGSSPADAQTQMPWPVVQQPDAAANTDARSGSAPALTTGAVDPAPSPVADAVSQIIAQRPMGTTDEDVADDSALATFYKTQMTPLWVDEDGINAAGRALILELQNADAWGLNPKAFKLPRLSDVTAPLATERQGALELQLSRAALLYARHARGGRIMAPSEMLNSHLNRTPQLIPPDEVLNGLATATNQANHLTTLHPQHPQFQRLRKAYLSVRAPQRQTRLRLKKTEALERGQRDTRVARVRKRLGLRRPVESDDTDLFDGDVEDAVRTFQNAAGITPADGTVDFDTARALNKRANVATAKLRANMEMWRWMWDNLGDLHVMANVPEFMLSLNKNGETLYRERTVVGQTSKKTSIFTRTLKHIVLRPMWRVPESIKVRELWPSLKRGGGLMREYGLKIETKDGTPVNWRRINWHRDDIRNYEVVQPPGRRSVMGKVKFSFPSQHTIFIHDTPDKYMFRSKRRTFSHGCLRLRNPVRLAHLLLKEDKGWDQAHVDDLIANGPNRNAIKIETRIPIHLVYFTAWVDDDGKLRSFRDIYGHEKRVRQALAGQWNRIAKGRNHLAAPQPIVARPGTRARARKRGPRPADYINRAISGGFF